MKSWIAASSVALALQAGAASAQDSQVASPTQDDTISITAHVEAKSIKFTEKGQMAARVWADPGGEGEWRLDRKGVPGVIPVGKTFDNVVFDLNAHVKVSQAEQGEAPAPSPSVARNPPR